MGSEAVFFLKLRASLAVSRALALRGPPHEELTDTVAKRIAVNSFAVRRDFEF
jgi:hypothetical protein